MVVVINHLHLSKPVDELCEPFEKGAVPILASQPGFRETLLVKTAEDRATVIII